MEISELLSYRVMPASDLKPLFWIDCRIEKFTQSTLEYHISAKSLSA